MRVKNINKTQFEVLETLVNRPHFVKSNKFRIDDRTIAVTLFNSNWINAAAKLDDHFPELLDFEQVGYKSEFIATLKDDIFARKLLDYNLGRY